MSTRHRVAKSILVIAVLSAASLAVFLPYLQDDAILLGPRSGLGTDISYRHWPDLTSYARVLREEGTIPLWDSTVAGGRPLAGDPGVLWLYPFGLLFLWLSPALAFNWLAMLHAIIGGIGGYLFCRRALRLSVLAAALGGLAYLASPKLIAHIAGGHVGLAYGAAWVPLALLGTHLASESDWRGIPLAAVALAFQLPTHVQIPFYTAWLMVVYALWRLATQRIPRGMWRRVSILAGILPAFVVFSAAELFPLVGLLGYTSRQGLSLDNASWLSLPPLLLTSFAIPTNFQFPEWVLYPGAVTLILALLAPFGRSRRESVFWWLVLVFSLLYAIGPAAPIFPLLHRLPGFGQLRVPPRIWFIGAFAITVLAALGAEAISMNSTNQEAMRWRRPIILIALAFVGAGGGAVIAFLILGTSTWRAVTTLLISLAVLGMVQAHLHGKLRVREFRALLLIVLALELVPTARLYTQAFPVEEILDETPAFSFLAEQPGLWRVYSSHGELPYAAAAGHGIEAAEGLLALQIGHYVELIKLASGCPIEGYGTGVPPCLTTEIDPLAYKNAKPDPVLLGLLNVRYVLTSERYQLADFELVADFGDERIYENQSWLPRAFVVFETQTLPDQASVLRSLRTLDPSRSALLAEPLQIDSSTPRSAVPAAVIRQSANEMTVQVQVEQQGLLVVSSTWMPGWQAWVDGEQSTVYRTDYALLGVRLPPGEHTVRLRYEPVGWQLGWPLSLTAFGSSGILFVGWILHRSSRTVLSMIRRTEHVRKRCEDQSPAWRS